MLDKFSISKRCNQPVPPRPSVYMYVYVGGSGVRPLSLTQSLNSFPRPLQNLELWARHNHGEGGFLEVLCPPPLNSPPHFKWKYLSAPWTTAERPPQFKWKSLTIEGFIKLLQKKNVKCFAIFFSKKSAAMKCLITNKEYNLVDLDRLEGRAEGKFKQRNDAKS